MNPINVYMHWNELLTAKGPARKWLVQLNFGTSQTAVGSHFQYLFISLIMEIAWRQQTKIKNLINISERILEVITCEDCHFSLPTSWAINWRRKQIKLVEQWSGDLTYIKKKKKKSEWGLWKAYCKIHLNQI